MAEKALVTGGAGFIGSHVAAQLLNRGYGVIVLDDLSGGFVDNIPQNADTVIGSILDRQLIDDLFETHHFTYVFHLAAYAAEGLSHFIKRFNYRNNLIGSVNLINAAVNHDVRCFVFTSSIAAYGSAVPPMHEDMTPAPEDPYGIAKYAVEMELRVTHEMFGLDYIIFRPHNVYGEHQNTGDHYRNVIGIFMRQALHNQPMTIFGDGTQTRAFSYISDVAPTIARAIEAPGARNQIFDIGADVPYSVNELSRVVAEAMDVPLAVVHLPERNEVKHAYSSHEKVRRVFGSNNPVPLAEGARRMAAWVRRVGVRKSQLFDEIEISRGMPASWTDVASVEAVNAVELS